MPGSQDLEESVTVPYAAPAAAAAPIVTSAGGAPEATGSSLSRSPAVSLFQTQAVEARVAAARDADGRNPRSPILGRPASQD